MAGDLGCLSLTHKYQISIRPYKCPQDHESLDINVKSLVHLFEQDEGETDHNHENTSKEGGIGPIAESSSSQSTRHSTGDIEMPSSFPERNYLNGNSSSASELPDIVVCSERKTGGACVSFDDDFYEPVTILPKHPALTRQRSAPTGQYGKGWEDGNPGGPGDGFSGEVTVVEDSHSNKYNDAESTDDFCMQPSDSSLLEALKDILDRTSQYKHNLRQGKDGKVKRVKLRDKKRNSQPRKSFTDQVEDIFRPNFKDHAQPASSDDAGDGKRYQLPPEDAVNSPQASPYSPPEAGMGEDEIPPPYEYPQQPSEAELALLKNKTKEVGAYSMLFKYEKKCMCRSG